jgi:hypothetical protein
MDAAVEVIKGVLAEVQQSGVAVSPILKRSVSRRSGNGANDSPTSSTPQGERRGTMRPRALPDGEAPDSKRQRYEI